MRNAIEKRISRRKYDKEPLTEQEMNNIITHIDRLNEISGLTMAFLEDGSYAFKKFTKTYGLLTNVRTLILMKGKKEDKNLKEKIGYYGEDLVLAITDLGLGTCWVGGTFDKKVLTIKDDEEMPCVIVVGKVSEQSIKEKFVRSASHRKIKSMEERLISNQPVPQWVVDGMKAVLLAPSAINSQKAMFKYENNRLSAFIKDDYPADLIDLGIAKKHFEIEARGIFELGNGGEFRVSDSKKV